MNKYEKSMFVNLKIMKILFTVVVLANLFFPIYKPFKFGFSTLFCYVFILIHVYGLRNGLGYGNQSVPLLPIVVFRLIQIGSHAFFFKAKINYIFFSVLLILELAFMLFLILDRSQFSYERSQE